MRRYLLRRLGQSVVTLVLSTMVVFAGVRALPGDPARALAGEQNDPAQVAAIRAKYGLDDPVPVQYWHYLTHSLRGDLGTSVRTGIPVSDMLRSALPVTAELSLLALLVATVIGVLAGVRGRHAPRHTRGVGRQRVRAAGPVGAELLARADDDPVARRRAGGAPGLRLRPVPPDPGQNLQHMILPALVLGTQLAAVIMRQTRSSMLDALETDYIRTARAKGLRERTVVWVHGLRNSLIVVVTIVGLQLGALISGAVVTERIFALPGFGKLTIDAVFQRDYPVIQAVVLVTATAYIVINLLVDLLYSLIDPRIRVSGEASVTVRRRRRRRPRRRRLLRRLRRSPLAMTGFVVLCLAVLAAVLAPVLAPYSPDHADFGAVFQPPGTSGHLLGTDSLGRDILSRILFGARASLLVGVLSVLLALVVGVPLGLVAGYVAALDAVVSRLTDVVLAFPFLILAVGLAAIRGASLSNAALAIGISQIPGIIRVTRSETLRLKSLDYVAAAVAEGASDLWVVVRAHPAERHQRAHRPGDGGDPRSDPGRGGAVLPRTRDPAAVAQSGHDALRGTGLHLASPVDRGDAGHRDHGAHLGVQPVRRRAPRRPRPARKPPMSIVTTDLDPWQPGGTGTPLLRVRDLSVSFRTEDGRVCAVDDVSFEARAGELLAVVGESGCGKSVMAMALSGLLPRNATVTGSVELAGQQLVGASPGDLRRVRGSRIAYIFQEPMTSLNPVFTVGRQVAEVLRVHEGMDRRRATRPGGRAPRPGRHRQPP